jgi:hypothetical protein
LPTNPGVHEAEIVDAGSEAHVDGGSRRPPDDPFAPERLRRRILALKCPLPCASDLKAGAGRLPMMLPDQLRAIAVSIRRCETACRGER